jgi:hypothetical protein
MLVGSVVPVAGLVGVAAVVLVIGRTHAAIIGVRTSIGAAIIIGSRRVAVAVIRP